MILVPIFCLIAAYQAYRNQGLTVSIAIVFAPLFAMISHGFGVGIFSEPTPLEWFFMGIRIGGGVALVLGTGMFLTGMAARLISDWNQTRKKNPEQTA
jgi:peptidoglycan hydrolase-like protein with peptidoglycan-binding domain